MMMTAVSSLTELAVYIPAILSRVFKPELAISLGKIVEQGAAHTGNFQELFQFCCHG